MVDSEDVLPLAEQLGNTLKKLSKPGIKPLGTYPTKVEEKGQEQKYEKPQSQYPTQ